MAELNMSWVKVVWGLGQCILSHCQKPSKSDGIGKSVEAFALVIKHSGQKIGVRGLGIFAAGTGQPCL
jgi:hypothetical protein